MIRPIDANALIAEYDRVHVGPPGRARKLIENAPTIEPGPQWTPCSIVNQCYIPELADIGYAGVLFTYVTRTGKRHVRETWVERGRLIGKQMNGVPVAYMPMPEPYREENK
jgi:hypothetical protein